MSVGVSPVTRTSLSRPRAPCSIVTAEALTPSAPASSAATAALAAPSTGGAATRTLRAPSARQPTILLRAARGCTRTRSSAGLGAGGGAVGLGLGGQHPRVAVQGDREVLDELAAQPLERLDLPPDLGPLAAGGDPVAQAAAPPARRGPHGHA